MATRKRPIITNSQATGSGAFAWADKRDIFPLPGGGVNEVDRKFTYGLLLAYYANKSFDTLPGWLKYRKRYGLYRYTRPLFNPVTKVVNFYVENIYPGLIADEVGLPSGTPSGIPLHPSTTPEIRQALAQVWKWSNWPTNQAVMVLYAALTGNCLVELIDDPVSGKLSFEVVWPGYVKSFEIDKYGELVAYELEYPVRDKDGSTYTYNKIVDRTTIQHYRDGQIIESLSGPNPYPFVPAVWVKHLDFGNDFGIPAVQELTKVDELNSVLSHTLDHIHKQIKSPRILWSEQNIGFAFSQNKNPLEDDFDERVDLPMLKGSKGGSTETLVGTLDAQTIVPVMQKIIDDLNDDYPEITLYQRLRDQNIVTGPSARQLVGDVARKVSRPAANYDKASVKLFQMALAVGGWRLKNGDWEVNESQKLFQTFDFDKFKNESIDIQLLPRDVIRESSKDKADELFIRAQAVSLVESILPIENKLRLLGYREEEIPDIMSRIERDRKAGLISTPMDLQNNKNEVQAEAAKLNAQNKPNTNRKKSVKPKTKGSSRDAQTPSDF